MTEFKTHQEITWAIRQTKKLLKDFWYNDRII